MSDRLPLDQRAEFNFFVLWADTQETDELPDDYEGGEWSTNVEGVQLPEAPLCSVHVRARYAGLSGESNAHGCSFESESDFEKSSLYEPMKIAALFDLAGKIDAQRVQLAELAA
jgi:hypothetical protein